jgi:hypothetical protein
MLRFPEKATHWKPANLLKTSSEETRIELATNNLEDYVSVENKRQARPKR